MSYICSVSLLKAEKNLDFYFYGIRFTIKNQEELKKLAMPELPEVETIKKQLKSFLIGKKIVQIKVLSKKQFSDNPKLVIGEKIIDVQRRAKLIVIKLSNNKNLLIHLKLNGQLVWVDNSANERLVELKKPVPTIGRFLPSKSTRVIFQIGKGKLFFNELRKFGWIRFFSDKELEKELSRYGVEPFSKKFTLDYLKDIFAKTNQAIKLILLDQKKIAGIGNIYANEALFLSKIHPQTTAKVLKTSQINRLRENIIKVLKLGLKYGGTSDEYYLKPDTTLGRYQNYFFVYGKKGEKCPRCSAKIKRIEIGGRGTFFCSKCQPQKNPE